MQVWTFRLENTQKTNQQKAFILIVIIIHILYELAHRCFEGRH